MSKVYKDSEQLYRCLQALFDRIKTQDPQSNQAVTKARLIIRFRCSAPAADVVINGRQAPLQITYGPTSLRPDLEVEFPADTLHAILLGQTRLRQALASGQMKVRGPILKTYALEEVLHQGQALYPDVLQEQGLNGYGAPGQPTE